MRYLLTLMATVMGSTAQAHIGHLGDIAAHDHWAAGAAIGIAIAIGIAGALKGKGKAKEDATDDEDEAEAEEQPA
jgi:hypothetical protein